MENGCVCWLQVCMLRMSSTTRHNAKSSACRDQHKDQEAGQQMRMHHPQHSIQDRKLQKAACMGHNTMVTSWMQGGQVRQKRPAMQPPGITTDALDVKK